MCYSSLYVYPVLPMSNVSSCAEMRYTLLCLAFFFNGVVVVFSTLKEPPTFFFPLGVPLWGRSKGFPSTALPCPVVLCDLPCRGEEKVCLRGWI